MRFFSFSSFFLVVKISFYALFYFPRILFAIYIVSVICDYTMFLHNVQLHVSVAVLLPILLLALQLVFVVCVLYVVYLSCVCVCGG